MAVFQSNGDAPGRIHLKNRIKNECVLIWRSHIGFVARRCGTLGVLNSFCSLYIYMHMNNRICIHICLLRLNLLIRIILGAFLPLDFSLVKLFCI